MRREIDTKIRKVGNSFIITIPMNIIKRWGLKEGENLTVIIKK